MLDDALRVRVELGAAKAAADLGLARSALLVFREDLDTSPCGTDSLPQRPLCSSHSRWRGCGQDGRPRHGSWGSRSEHATAVAPRSVRTVSCERAAWHETSAGRHGVGRSRGTQDLWRHARPPPRARRDASIRGSEVGRCRSKSHQVQPGVGTLQEALNRARDGSELVLADGTYGGSGSHLLTISKSITIRAEHPGRAKPWQAGQASRSAREIRSKTLSNCSVGCSSQRQAARERTILHSNRVEQVGGGEVGTSSYKQA